MPKFGFNQTQVHDIQPHPVEVRETGLETGKRGQYERVIFNLISLFAASDIIEEDGGFGSGFGERTRCATLQRQRMQQNNQNNQHFHRPQPVHNGDRFMTLGVGGGSHQNFRAMHNDYDSLSRIKNNITSLVSSSKKSDHTIDSFVIF